MLSINHRHKLGFIKVKDIYYAPEVMNEHPGYDAVYYFNCQEPDINATEFNTMLIDLAPEPEMILNSFRKSTRVKIKKILRDPSLKYQMSENPEDHEMESYFRNYNCFAAQKRFIRVNETCLMLFILKGV